MISWRRRWARIASACALRIGLGKASNNCGSTSLSSASCSSSAASCSDELGDRQHDRQLGPSQAAIFLRAAEQLLARCQPFDLAVEPAGGFEQLDRPDVAGKRLRAAGFGDRQREALQPIVLEHDLGDLVGHLARAACCACRTTSRPSRISRLSGILMLTSLSEQSTPAELSMKSVLMRPPCVREFDAPGLGDGEVGAFADDLGANFVGAGAKRVVGRVADVRLRSAPRP